MNTNDSRIDWNRTGSQEQLRTRIKNFNPSEIILLYSIEILFNVWTKIAVVYVGTPLILKKLKY